MKKNIFIVVCVLAICARRMIKTPRLCGGEFVLFFGFRDADIHCGADLLRRVGFHPINLAGVPADRVGLQAASVTLADVAHLDGYYASFRVGDIFKDGQGAKFAIRALDVDVHPAPGRGGHGGGLAVGAGG